MEEEKEDEDGGGEMEKETEEERGGGRGEEEGGWPASSSNWVLVLGREGGRFIAAAAVWVVCACGVVCVVLWGGQRPMHERKAHDVCDGKGPLVCRSPPAPSIRTPHPRPPQPHSSQAPAPPPSHPLARRRPCPRFTRQDKMSSSTTQPPPTDTQEVDAASPPPPPPPQAQAEEEEEEEEDYPALPGQLWMEGDSLAPPCQSDLDLVPHIISLAHLSSSDTFIDLGCGKSTHPPTHPRADHPPMH